MMGNEMDKWPLVCWMCGRVVAWVSAELSCSTGALCNHCAAETPATRDEGNHDE